MKPSNKLVLVTGNFEILHPGHIRLLKFAKECGDTLCVAVSNDSAMGIESRVNEDHRLEMVKSLECVDEAFLTSLSPIELVKKMQPSAIVKGKEFEEKHNPELAELQSYGGKLIFGSGEFESNSEQFLRKAKKLRNNFDFSEMHSYCKRHQISLDTVSECLESVTDIRAIVFGEVIVDEYIHGTAVGLSQEDPTIVMTPNKTDSFLGGAAITAGHIKSIGAKEVSLFSVLGNDQAAKYAQSQIHDYKVTPHFFVDDSRPTPLKTRYRAGNKTLLRVNQVRQHKISKELQTTILSNFVPLLSKVDLVVFSDFNYGILPTSLVTQITDLCREKNIKVVADSQTSSQVGDISRYHSMDLITPTEREVRVALNNPDDGLVILAQKLTQKSQPKNLIITLAEEGIFIHIPNHDFSDWKNDTLPAINKLPVDPAGAGDCFFAASSLALAAGSPPWQAFYLGSLAAGCQVSSLGNTPLDREVLEHTIKESFR